MAEKSVDLIRGTMSALKLVSTTIGKESTHDLQPEMDLIGTA